MRVFRLAQVDDLRHVVQDFAGYPDGVVAAPIFLDGRPHVVLTGAANAEARAAERLAHGEPDAVDVTSVVVLDGSEEHRLLPPPTAAL